ncbi:MAG: hypothetical protein ABSC10_19610 [Candidatus Acidiferrales bacterium]|jgi:hypothetical protein
MILTVSYDLKSTRDYTPFYEALKQQGSWWHYLASTWLISTDNTPVQVADAIRPYMDTSDFLLVAEMGKLRQGYLPKPAWDWIEEHTKQAESNTLIQATTMKSLSDLLSGANLSPLTGEDTLLDGILGGEKPKTALLSDMAGGKTRPPWAGKK